MAAGDSWFAVGPGAGPDRRRRSERRVGALVRPRRRAGLPVRGRVAGLGRPRAAASATPRRASSSPRAAGSTSSTRCLRPIGFAIALAAAGRPWALMLPLPLFLLLLIFARERTARLQSLLELSSAYRGTAHVLGDMIGHDDTYTGTHSRSVVELSVSPSRPRSGSTSAAAATSSSAPCSTTSARSRSRTRSSTSRARSATREWTAVRTHTVEGQRMLEKIGGLMSEIGAVVRSSHERYDGGGYPDGLDRRGDPGRVPDHLRLRRVQRDDDGPALPDRAARSRRRSPSSRTTPAPSSTPGSSASSSARSATATASSA